MIRAPKTTDVALLAAVIFAVMVAMMILAIGCAPDARPAIYIVDAATDTAIPDAPPDALMGPSTWWEAYLAWEEIDCEHLRRCDYGDFYFLFDGSLPDCQSYLAQQDCNKLDPMHGPVNCISTYPSSRWSLVAECATETAAESCADSTPPDSCETAFDPTVMP